MKVHIPFIFILLITSILPTCGRSQTKALDLEIADSTREKEHSPTKATIMSALLPGLGQIYNKKYWKVPVIYAGIGVMTYFIVFNADEYLNYKCAYIEKNNGDTEGNYKDLVNRYTLEELMSAREYYRRNLEISCLISALWYVLNIVDAAVDAHLYTYNITDKLSFKLEPVVEPVGFTSRSSTGLKISFHF
jgi:hypothetical protein